MGICHKSFPENIYCGNKWIFLGRGFQGMNYFIENLLKIKYLPPMNKIGPIDGRKYTFIRSKNLYVSVSKKYDLNLVDPNHRNELLAKWQRRDGEYQLVGKMYVSGGEFDHKIAKSRYDNFKKEAATALTAIIFGEQELFFQFPWLLDAPIYIQFESEFPEYNQVIDYGTPRQYLQAVANKPKVKTRV